uniref:RRM domain-containing protein n=1 Tax=Chlamydomonas leiostraca TaxID=1034604 RepID=A0A7S0S4L0_9CHLO|mmetsp:Transcript_862/g.2302  ORF Transcript_862/g.2302 Transcript_862/m.2302 type:complete len:562 (+) Transcript_862:225-1910(+)
MMAMAGHHAYGLDPSGGYGGYMGLGHQGLGGMGPISTGSAGMGMGMGMPSPPDPILPPSLSGSAGASAGGVNAYMGGSAHQMNHATLMQYRGMPAEEEVRTIFITGFPPDVRDRELHNLTRFLPGFEASQMSTRTAGQPQGFALFASGAHARQAVDALAGLPFDSTTSASATASPAPSVAGGAPGPAPVAAHTHTVSLSGPSGPGSSAALSHEAPGSGSATTTTSAPHSASGSVAGGDDGQARSSGGGAAPHQNGHHEPAGTTTNAAVAAVAAPPAATGPSVVYKLRCEMAHKNMYLKDNDPTIRRAHRPLLLLPNPGTATHHAVAAAMQAMNNLNLGGNARPGMYSSDNGSMRVNGSSTHYNATNGTTTATHALPLPNQSHAGAASGPGSTAASVSGLPLGGALGFLPVTNRGDNPPCNTLFIGNLSDTVSEVELMQLFSAQPGYRQMKLVRGPKQQVSCFVEFEDVVAASTVHNALQGAVLASSDRGGVRIQYSRNPFGRRSSNPGGGAGGLGGAGGAGTGGVFDAFGAAAASGGAWPSGLPLYPSVSPHIAGGAAYYY